MDIYDVKEWLRFADNDLDSALFLNTAVRKHHEIICYHCAQAAEKYLKAYLISQNIIPKKTHDLVYLNKSCQSFDADFSKILDECAILDRFSSDMRYPLRYEIAESDVKIAISYATKIKGFELILNLRNSSE
jgi:HEPN domain-containing protein